MIPMRVLSFIVAVFVAAGASASCIHGYVRTADGASVRDANVTLVADQKKVNEGSSDGRGWFRVDPKRRGEFGVLIVAPGFAPRLLKASAGQDLGVVTLVPARQVGGVLQCDRKAIREAVRVVLVGKDGAEVALTSDATGAFQLADPAVWLERVIVDGHENERCQIQ